jgi:hypothetical protein
VRSVDEEATHTRFEPSEQGDHVLHRRVLFDEVSRRDDEVGNFAELIGELFEERHQTMSARPKMKVGDVKHREGRSARPERHFLRRQHEAIGLVEGVGRPCCPRHQGRSYESHLASRILLPCA